MGDLGQEFKDKMSKFGLNFNWFEYPAQLIRFYGGSHLVSSTD